MDKILMKGMQFYGRHGVFFPRNESLARNFFR